jgi:pimeloyl-ACP methyl ester carboxylesterase
MGDAMETEDFVYNASGKSLVIVFSSYGRAGAHGETAFAQPRFEFMNALQSHGLSCLFLKDPVQHWYHSGVPGLGDDIPSLADTLRGYASRHSHTITLGHSMGGYAALLFAALCSLDGAVATAPQTSIEPSHRAKWRDGRWGAKIGETQEISTTPTYFDLAPLLMTSPKPRYRVFYTGEHRADRRHASHIAKIPGVEAVSFAGRVHNAAKLIRDSGELNRILAEASIQ